MISIYKLTCSETGKCYYGKSKHPHVRLYQHKYNKSTTSRFLINPIMEILEEVEPDKANEREGFYIKNNDCVNKITPSQTKDEYMQINKEKIKKQRQEHYQKNKQHLIEKSKEYREKNREINLLKAKEYYQKNKEYKKQKRKEYYQKQKNKEKNK